MDIVAIINQYICLGEDDLMAAVPFGSTVWELLWCCVDFDFGPLRLAFHAYLERCFFPSGTFGSTSVVGLGI